MSPAICRTAEASQPEARTLHLVELCQVSAVHSFVPEDAVYGEVLCRPEAVLQADIKSAADSRLQGATRQANEVTSRQAGSEACWWVDFRHSHVVCVHSRKGQLVIC